MRGVQDGVELLPVGVNVVAGFVRFVHVELGDEPFDQGVVITARGIHTPERLGRSVKTEVSRKRTVIAFEIRSVAVNVSRGFFVMNRRSTSENVAVSR